MHNIFKNAYFGKTYKTRDNRKAIYSYCIKGKPNEHYLIVEGNQSLLGGYGDDGIINACGYHNSNLDIVSEWQEEIVLKGFVAVDNGGDKTIENPSGRRVILFEKKPFRDTLGIKPYWASPYSNIKLDWDSFSHMSWKDEPIGVELKVISK